MIIPFPDGEIKGTQGQTTDQAENQTSLSPEATGMGQCDQSSSLATVLVHVWGDPGASYRAYLGPCTAPCLPRPIWGDMGPQEPPDPGLASSNSRSEGDTVRHSQPRSGPARLVSMGIAICGQPHSGHLRITHLQNQILCGNPKLA